jgi:enoyl-CoA hydratase
MSGEGSGAPVLVRRAGSVGVLTLNVPDRRNALSAGLATAIGTALDELEADESVHALVLTGNGATFCAGAELAVLEAAADGDFAAVRGVYAGFLRVLHSPLATIAAVNGPAVGAGFNLALACDVRLAGERARFETRFTDLRIHPGGGHAWMLIGAVGPQRATLACLYGEVWDAYRARDLGLVAEVHPDCELVAAAVALGRRLDGQETEYTRRLVASLRSAATTAEHGAALAHETAEQEWSTTRPAFREGLRGIRRRIAGVNTVVDDDTR